MSCTRCSRTLWPRASKRRRLGCVYSDSILCLFSWMNFEFLRVFFFPRNGIVCDVMLTFVVRSLSLSLSLSRKHEQPTRNSRRTSRPCRKSTTSRCTIYTRNSAHPSKKNRGRNSSKF
jgi:hypothetical protein